MPINADKPHLWKADVERSIDFYNDWFLRFAPETFRTQRAQTTGQVANALEMTELLRNVSPKTLMANPGVLPILRMVCAPPLARDRLIGLAHLSKNLVSSMEGKPDTPPRMPPRMAKSEQMEQLRRISDTIGELADRDLFPWLETGDGPTEEQVDRAAMVVADRLCGAASDPIIRNAQEQRQLETLSSWLVSAGYRNVPPGSVDDILQLPPGTFAFRMNVQVGEGTSAVNISVDCVVQSLSAHPGNMPILIEAKSAGDAANTNKRRKEEAQKYRQLTSRFGKSVRYVLFLCGYFEPGYLGYEASEGIDWIWEHRLSDLELLCEHAIPEEEGEAVHEEPGVYTTPQENREAQRFSQQKEIDNSRPQVDRNRMGQFSTPFSLASDVVRYAWSQKGESDDISFLEPALGTGVFFSALQSLGGNAAVTRATGVEVDSEYSGVAANLWRDLPFEVITCDFLAFSARPDRQKLYNLLCTNPPYVRHHHLPSSLKLSVRDRVGSTLGLTPSGLSGLYVYFILLSHGLLAEEAVASWLVPSEFLSVNYGSVLRHYLLNCVNLVRIHQFDPTDVQFDDALVSSCVVTYIKKKPSDQHSFQFTYGGTLEAPRDCRTIGADEVSPSEKWCLSAARASDTAIEESGVRIGDVFEVKRGVATGSNAFFIVDRQTVDEHEIPGRFLRPILPSPRYVSELVITADADGFPQVDGARYLLDCRLPPDMVRNKYPGLWRYLEEGESKGVSDCYLCSNRKIWYLQEQRTPALYLATYMSRSRSTDSNPFRFFLNLSEAIATNVFLLLYPKPILMASIDGNRDRMNELLALLNGLAREHVVNGGRTYGGGLHKLEPKELANLHLPYMPEWMRVSKQPELALWQDAKDRRHQQMHAG